MDRRISLIIIIVNCRPLKRRAKPHRRWIKSPFQREETSDRSGYKVIEHQLRYDYLRILVKLLQRGLNELICRIGALKLSK
jgi:hypothetical protein